VGGPPGPLAPRGPRAQVRPPAMGAVTCCEVQSTAAFQLAQAAGSMTTWPSGTRHPEDPLFCPGNGGPGAREGMSSLEDPQSLKEYTYAVDAGLHMLDSAFDNGSNLSFRSNASDLERQALFVRRKLEVAAQAEARAWAAAGDTVGAGGPASARATGAACTVPALPLLGREAGSVLGLEAAGGTQDSVDEGVQQSRGDGADGQQGEYILSKYKALGINVVAQ